MNEQWPWLFACALFLSGCPEEPSSICVDVDVDDICDEADSCVDADQDGYGRDASDRDGCPGGDAVDCDDFGSHIHPNAPELCDAADNDCDEIVPEDEVDADGDGQAECAGDCDDVDASIHDGAPELCDGLDNDCDGSPGADEVDADADGVMVCSGDCDDVDATSYPRGRGVVRRQGQRL